MKDNLDEAPNSRFHRTTGFAGRAVKRSSVVRRIAAESEED
jgi:hypothetical protein